MMINGDRSQEMEYERARAITRTQRGLGQGSGQSLAPFLGKLINFGDETQADFLSHPVAKKFLEPHSDDVKADENIAELVCFCSLPDFEAFVKDVQLSKDCLSVLASQPGQILMKSEGLSFVLLQASVDNKKLLNQIVKLPDILCNAFEGKLPEDLKVEDLIEHVLYNILLCHRLYLSAGSSNIQPLLNVLAYSVGCAITNYSVYEDVLEKYVSCIRSLALMDESSSLKFADLVSAMSDNHQTTFIKVIFRGVQSGEEAFPILRLIPPGKLCTLCSKVLFSRSSFSQTEMFSKFVCFLNLALSRATFMQKVLIPAFSLWGDPVISRAYVKSEVVHHTKMIFIIFSHLSKETVTKFQSTIVRELTRGLPNHFSSSDPRTVELAKFLCELVTETMKFYDKQIEKVSEQVQRPSEPLCREVLGSFHVCKSTSHFWFADICKTTGGDEPVKIKPEEDKTDSEVSVDTDDDDDDDLTPIDTCDVPNKSRIVYIRDFLEQLPELKTYDETKAAFSALPPVIRHQLQLEHPQLGRDLLDVVFRWENSYDSPVFDELKKANLCMTLQTKMEGNVDHLCSFFNRPTIQIYKKNQILDVLTTVSKQVCLKDLEILAKVTFRDLLHDPESIQRLDTINKIPMILFFQRLLCILPHQMIREEMVTSYLRAVTNVNDIDASLRQTIQYAIHNLMTSLEGVEITRNIRSSIVDTRSWLWSLQNLSNLRLQ